MELIRYWNPICVVIMICMSFTVVALTPMVFGHSDDRTALATICMSSMLTGLLVCDIMFCSVYLDRRISKATFYFMCLISMEFIGLVVEICYWQVREVDFNGPLLNIVYHLEHLILPPLIYLFTHYELIILRVPTVISEKIHRIMWILIAAEATMVLLNYFTECLFYTDGKDYVNLSAGYVTMVPSAILAAISLLVAYTYSPDAKHRYTLLLCMLVPMAAAALFYSVHIPSFTLMSILIVFLLMYGQIYLDRGIRVAKYEATLTEQKVALMVSRIEPEFLDDALDHIAELEGNPPETETALKEFRKYLDENFSSLSKKDPIPFEDEIEHVMTYINLEKLRFKNKMHVVMELNDTDFKIPPMTLQMLVENAVKHGITQKEGGGTIAVVTEEQPKAHVITVTDDGVGFDTDAPYDPGRSHMGLANITSRLNTMSGGTLEIRSMPGEGTVAVVRIPKQ